MKCLRCGKDFEPAPKNARRQKYCSRKCALAASNDRRRLGRNLDKPPLPSKAICHECGEVFKPAYPAEKFCSDECRFSFFHPSLILAFGKFFGFIKDSPSPNIFIREEASS